MADKSNDRILMPPSSSSPRRSPFLPPSHPSGSPSLAPSHASRGSGGSQPRTNVSSAFSDTVKLEVARLSGEACWSCSNTNPQFAHVVAQKDDQAHLWLQAGLFPFSFKAAANCIPLCPTCHSAFDCCSDPFWVFLPTDLNFFIRYEVEDQVRRAQDDQRSDRIVPTSEEYRDHLASRGLVSYNAIGGLYRGYFLKNFLHGGQTPFEFLQFLTPHKPWHGHPLAAVRRGIAVLGSARCYVLDRTTIDELTTLRRLYFDDKNLIDKNLVQLYHLPPADRKTKRSDDESDHESDDESDPNDQKKLATKTGDRGTAQDTHVCFPANSSGLDAGAHTDAYANTEWVFGPNATGNDVINRFAPLLRSTDVIKLLS